MQWSGEQCTVDRTGNEDAVLFAANELGRRALQLRGNPDVAAVEK